MRELRSLKGLRKFLGLTLHEMATVLGVSKSMAHQVETNERVFSGTNSDKVRELRDMAVAIVEEQRDKEFTVTLATLKDARAKMTDFRARMNLEKGLIAKYEAELRLLHARMEVFNRYERPVERDGMPSAYNELRDWILSRTKQRALKLQTGAYARARERYVALQAQHQFWKSYVTELEDSRMEKI